MTPAGQPKGTAAVESVLCGSGLLIAPDQPRMFPRGLSKAKLKAGLARKMYFSEPLFSDSYL